MRIVYLRVQPGDHLSSIAALFSTTAGAVLRDNALARPEDIRPGMVLRIVAGNAPGAKGEPHSVVSSPTKVAVPGEHHDSQPKTGPGSGLSPRPASWTAGHSSLPAGRPAVPAAERKPAAPRDGVGHPRPSLPGVITQGPGDRRMVALTFETSFGTGGVAAVLDSLRRHGAAATWFWSGDWAKRNPELARQILRAGHQIEVHGHMHQHLRELAPSEVRRDLEQAGAAVLALTGRKPRYLRPPFGSFNPVAAAAAAELGYRVVLWSVDSLDWQNPGVAEISERVMRRVHPGAIVLMHANADQAPAALERILPGLKDAGYRLVTLDQLLAGGPGGATAAGTPRPASL